jgi:hypothetical protein
VIRSRKTKVLAAAAAACLVGGAAAADAAAAPTVQRFTATGKQFWAVPAGITNLHVVAIGGMGGRGGGATASTATPGRGAVATADVSVTPGEILEISVGDNGGNGAGRNPGPGGVGGGASGGLSGAATGYGGGGGGGFSDIRAAGTTNLLETFVLAAGGGGVGGGANAGGGGNAATNGGLGGGSGATGGGLGGGLGASGAPATCCVSGGPNGVPGIYGAGGAGQSGANLVAAGAGGGGGGGLVGGNGGVTGSGGGSNGGGGGAGSGNFNGRAVNTSYVLDTTGVPSVTITYELPTTPGGNLPGGGNNGGGGGGGGGGTNGLPILSAFRLSSTEFVPARRGGPTGGTQGTTVSYRATVAARTTFAIQARRSGVRSGGQCVRRTRGRRGSSCTRYVTVGTFTRTGIVGLNTFNFTGRINGRKLSSGRYRLQATAQNDAGKSAPVRASFRIAS